MMEDESFDWAAVYDVEKGYPGFLAYISPHFLPPTGDAGLYFPVFRDPFAFTMDVNRKLRYFEAEAIPEPAAWATMLIGFCGIGAAIRRSRQRKNGSFALAS
jgi:hypothetical protein